MISDDLPSDAFVDEELAALIPFARAVWAALPLPSRTVGSPDMDARAWTTALSEAFDDFQERLQHGKTLPIDGYAATSPAEFFAVFSEVFFECPHILNHYYPAVYQQFKQFYRQDTLQRMNP